MLHEGRIDRHKQKKNVSEGLEEIRTEKFLIGFENIEVRMT